MLNLDTHVLTCVLRGELAGNGRRLPVPAQWSISSIVFWEIAKLIRLDRVEETSMTRGPLARGDEPC